MSRRDLRSSKGAWKRGKGASLCPTRPRPPQLADWRFLVLLAAGLVPLFFYWPTTGYGFVLDDTLLFRQSPSLADLGSIPKGFLTDLGALRSGTDTVVSSFYRPVFLALSTLYYQVVGGEPFGWHLAAVAVAGLIGALSCGFFLRLGFPPLVALLGSIVFSLHPAHVSSVAWASGLQELLAALFALLALHAALWRMGEERDTLPLALAAVAFTLGVLSKEVAIALLPFVALWAFATAQSDPPISRRLWKLSGVLGIVALLYLGVRVAVLGGLARPAANAVRLVNSLPSMQVAFATYLRLLVWPTGFSFFRPERPRFEPCDAPVLVSVSVVAALVMLAAWAWKRRRPLVVPIAWFVVWLLPVLNLWVLPPHYMVTDRYLFLPSLALPWSLGLIKPRRLAILALSLLVVTFGPSPPATLRSSRTSESSWRPWRRPSPRAR